MPDFEVWKQIGNGEPTLLWLRAALTAAFCGRTSARGLFYVLILFMLSLVLDSNHSTHEKRDKEAECFGAIKQLTNSMDQRTLACNWRWLANWSQYKESGEGRKKQKKEKIVFFYSELVAVISLKFLILLALFYMTANDSVVNSCMLCGGLTRHEKQFVKGLKTKKVKLESRPIWKIT